MTDRVTEIRARLDAAAGTVSGTNERMVWDSDKAYHMEDDRDRASQAFHRNAPADIAWLLERESQMMGALAVMTDLAAYDGGAVGRESLDECLRDFGFTLEEVESRDGR